MGFVGHLTPTCQGTYEAMRFPVYVSFAFSEYTAGGTPSGSGRNATVRSEGRAPITDKRSRPEGLGSVTSPPQRSCSTNHGPTRSDERSRPVAGLSRLELMSRRVPA